VGGDLVIAAGTVKLLLQRYAIIGDPQFALLDGTANLFALRNELDAESRHAVYGLRSAEGDGVGRLQLRGTGAEAEQQDGVDEIAVLADVCHLDFVGLRRKDLSLAAADRDFLGLRLGKVDQDADVV